MTERTASGTPAAPEIVERDWPEAEPPAGAECAAEKPQGEILDRTSSVFRRIDVRRASVRIEERAV